MTDPLTPEEIEEAERLASEASGPEKMRPALRRLLAAHRAHVERIAELTAERDEARADCDAYAEFDEYVRDVVDAADAWHDRECSGEHTTCLETDHHAAECPVSKAEERLFQAVRAIQPISLAPHPRVARLTTRIAELEAALVEACDIGERCSRRSDVDVRLSALRSVASKKEMP